MTGLDRRLSEAARLGFRHALVPAGSLAAPSSPPASAPSRSPTCRVPSRPWAASPVDGQRAQPPSAPSRLRPDRVDDALGTPIANREVMDRNDELQLRAALAAVAPGTELRDSLERILRGRTGALIVLGFDVSSTSICTGGFVLDMEFSATRVRELCKMDGAVVLDREGTRILRAATQLVPDSSIETTESGTRHRTAERVAKQTGYPVISVSQSMGVVALYVGDLRARHRGVADDPVARRPGAADPRAIQGPSRRGHRHPVRARDRGPRHGARRHRRAAAPRDGAASPPPRSRTTSWSSAPTGACSAPAARGARGRARQRPRARHRDYLPATKSGLDVDEALDNLQALNAVELLDLAAGARAVGFSVVGDSLDLPVSPQGYRLLTKVPRLPTAIVDRLVTHFESLQRLLAAGIEDLMLVEGVGEGRARACARVSLAPRRVEHLERYVSDRARELTVPVALVPG